MSQLRQFIADEEEEKQKIASQITAKARGLCSCKAKNKDKGDEEEDEGGERETEAEGETKTEPLEEGKREEQKEVKASWLPWFNEGAEETKVSVQEGLVEPPSVEVELASLARLDTLPPPAPPLGRSDSLRGSPGGNLSFDAR